MSNPRGEYIPINSIEDIDPANITIRDLNKRYIDRYGNRYATRFNLQNRKVEIVQIVKGMHEAQRIKQQRMQDQTRPAAAARPAAPDADEEPEDEDDDMMEDASTPDSFDEEVDTGQAAETDHAMPFIEQQFIDEVEADFERIKQRQQGVLNNLKQSGVFVGDLDEKLATVTREMESDAWGKCENAINYSRELRSYPRPVSYYATKLSNEQKAKVEALDDDARKLELVRRWELQKAFEDAYAAVRAAGLKAKKLIDDLPPEMYEQTPAAQRQNLDDANTSIQFMLDQISEKVGKIKLWRQRYRE